jgi:hypothetical protein
MATIVKLDAATWREGYTAPDGARCPYPPGTTAALS